MALNTLKEGNAPIWHLWFVKSSAIYALVTVNISYIVRNRSCGLTTMKPNTNDLIKFFYRQSPDDPSVYYCRNAKCVPKQGHNGKAYKQKPNSGWTNLRNHLRVCVGPNFEDVYREHEAQAGGNIDGFFFNSTRDSEVFQLLEWLVMRNQPLSELDNDLTRRLVKAKPIHSQTMRKYILNMVPLVERAVTTELPDKFALLFDGWSDGPVHYVGLFATYCTMGEYRETLVAFSPLLQEDAMGAEQHLEFIKESLDVYRKSLANVVAFISDNCTVNRRLSTLTSIPLLGCVAHKFNLAVEDWCASTPGLIDALKSVRELMAKLRTLKNAAKLRELTHLGALLPNETRWTGKFDMIQRFFRLENCICKIEELDSYTPSPAKRRVLQRAVPHLAKFADISHNLQRKGLLLDKARFYFNAIVKDYPSMHKYLAPDTSIVHNPTFESAIVKLLQNQERDLSDFERCAVQVLRLPQTQTISHEHEDGEDGTNLSYFQEIEAKRRRLEMRTEYILPNFLPATSCTVERLFSSAKWVLSDVRKRMSPILAEAILFLKFNRRLWNMKTVALAMKMDQNSRYGYDDNLFYE